jgi:hypothetical protein
MRVGDEMPRGVDQYYSSSHLASSKPTNKTGFIVNNITIPVHVKKSRGKSPEPGSLLILTRWNEFLNLDGMGREGAVQSWLPIE